MLVGMWGRLFSDPVNWRLAAVVIVPTALIAWAASRAVKYAAGLAMRRMLGDTAATTSPVVRAPLRLIGLTALALVFCLLVFPAFEVAGLHPRAGVHLRTLSTWAFDSGLRVLLIVGVAFAIVRTVALSVKR